MAATRSEISKWFDEGILKGAKHMLVICDTYDYEDYPLYTTTDSECLAKHRFPGEMQRVMEVYDLSSDKAIQMMQGRAMRLPTNLNHC